MGQLSFFVVVVVAVVVVVSVAIVVTPRLCRNARTRGAALLNLQCGRHRVLIIVHAHQITWGIGNLPKRGSGLLPQCIDPFCALLFVHLSGQPTSFGELPVQK